IASTMIISRIVKPARTACRCGACIKARTPTDFMSATLLRGAAGRLRRRRRRAALVGAFLGPRGDIVVGPFLPVGTVRRDVVLALVAVVAHLLVIPGVAPAVVGQLLVQVALPLRRIRIRRQRALVPQNLDAFLVGGEAVVVE